MRDTACCFNRRSDFNEDPMLPLIVQLSNRLSYEYVEQGTATASPVICLHGYSDSWKSFEAAFPYLSEGLHVLALSQRGHGNSDCPSADYSPENFASDVALFLDHMHLGSAVIVGHSMGGTIAQRFVLDYPQKTKALVLVNSFSSFCNNQSVASLQAAVSQLSDPVDSLFVKEFQGSTVVKPGLDSLLNIMVNESLKVPARVWKSVLDGLMNVDYTQELRKCDKPVLLLWGDQDNFVTRNDQDRLLNSTADCRLIVYTGSGHSLHWEEPQRFAHDIQTFVSSLE